MSKIFCSSGVTLCVCEFSSVFLEWELSAYYSSKVNVISRGRRSCMYVFRHVYSLYLI